jgi:hypothetical protein
MTYLRSSWRSVPACRSAIDDSGVETVSGAHLCMDIAAKQQLLVLQAQHGVRILQVFHYVFRRHSLPQTQWRHITLGRRVLSVFGGAGCWLRIRLLRDNRQVVGG